MCSLTSQQYWNHMGSKKDFEDPLYLDKLSPFLTPNSRIVEYGCGYGRLMHLLKEQGYHDLTGFDFAPNMIERGKNIYPHLPLHLLQESGKIPCQNESVDVVIMSTVLCCMVNSDDQAQLIEEILRVLKSGGALYLSDFLICDHINYKEKYREGFRRFGIWGTYTTSEHLIVRHLTSKYVFGLMKDFNIQWFEQFDFKTMNHNPARTFHCIGLKTIEAQ